MDKQKKLRNIPQILSISPVTLTPALTAEIRRDYPDELALAKKVSRQVRAYEIMYRSAGIRIAGFIVEPVARKKRPCIFYNRGGTEDFGVITRARLFTRLGRIAAWGYFVIASQYPGSPGSEGRDEHGGSDLQHVLNLKKIIQQYAYADAARIGMFGHSRGGMMTYLALAKVRWIKAAVSHAGSADIFRAAKTRKDLKAIFRRNFGLNKQAFAERSAVRWAKNMHAKTPLLLLHGTADWRVSVLDSIDLAKQLYLHRKPHRLVVFEGADHSLSEVRDEAYEMTRMWFSRYLQEDDALPDLNPHGP